MVNITLCFIGYSPCYTVFSLVLWENSAKNDWRKRGQPDLLYLFFDFGKNRWIGQEAPQLFHIAPRDTIINYLKHPTRSPKASPRITDAIRKIGQIRLSLFSHFYAL